MIIANMFSLGNPALATDLNGTAEITDGDTVIVAGRKIRLLAMDAPETDQFCLDANSVKWQCGLAARDALVKMSARQMWSCKTTGRMTYDRELASCSVGGEDIGKWMVREGWALSFTRYSREYENDEELARSRQVGLWSGAFIAP